ncbi:hypothetical protein J437_LFUL008848 [Ladona fulva]|uniref:Uncharacterized protein n=1 Tax=Ladona fulva TaxID=123851 RepID=A0A8K0P043_LADFU|nr:hypothetical protein J437_LFUL008848 [Ladona fulva]
MYISRKVKIHQSYPKIQYSNSKIIEKALVSRISKYFEMNLISNTQFRFLKGAIESVITMITDVYCSSKNNESTPV